MKSNSRIFIDIKTICNFFRNGICQILPGFHSITSYYTTSYLFGVGKISPLRKCGVSANCICYKMWQKNTDSFKILDKRKLFFQTILYSGKENETYVFTR